MKKALKDVPRSWDLEAENFARNPPEAGEAGGGGDLDDLDMVMDEEEDIGGSGLPAEDHPIGDEDEDVPMLEI